MRAMAQMIIYMAFFEHGERSGGTRRTGRVNGLEETTKEE